MQRAETGASEDVGWGTHLGLDKEAFASAAEVKPESFSIALSGRGLDRPGAISHVAFFGTAF